MLKVDVASDETENKGGSGQYKPCSCKRAKRVFKKVLIFAAGFVLAYAIAGGAAEVDFNNAANSYKSAYTAAVTGKDKNYRATLFSKMKAYTRSVGEQLGVIENAQARAASTATDEEVDLGNFANWRGGYQAAGVVREATSDLKNAIAETEAIYNNPAYDAELENAKGQYQSAWAAYKTAYDAYVEAFGNAPEDLYVFTEITDFTNYSAEGIKGEASDLTTATQVLYGLIAEKGQDVNVDYAKYMAAWVKFDALRGEYQIAGGTNYLDIVELGASASQGELIAGRQTLKNAIDDMQKVIDEKLAELSNERQALIDQYNDVYGKWAELGLEGDVELQIIISDNSTITTYMNSIAEIKSKIAQMQADLSSDQNLVKAQADYQKAWKAYLQAREDYKVEFGKDVPGVYRFVEVHDNATVEVYMDYTDKCQTATKKLNDMVAQHVAANPTIEISGVGEAFAGLSREDKTLIRNQVLGGPRDGGFTVGSTVYNRQEGCVIATFSFEGTEIKVSIELSRENANVENIIEALQMGRFTVSVSEAEAE